MTLDFLYSTMTFLSDAPLAQLDRALDFGFKRPGSNPSGRATLNEFEPPCQMEVEKGRRIFEFGLRMHHLRRGPFAPVGKGFFSTRSASKGISEAAKFFRRRSAVPSVLGALRAFPPGPSRSGPVRLLPQRSDGGWIRDSTWVREFPSERPSGRGS